MPRGELRRSDRAMDATGSEELLETAMVGRIGSVGEDGTPYVVPMNFVYEREASTIYLHCASSGHLLENLAGNTRVCFEVDEPGAVVVSSRYACDTSQVYRSVICFGSARVLRDGPEKVHAMDLFAQKYVDRLAPDFRYEPEYQTIDSTAAIAVRVDTMTGKQRRQP